MAPIGQSVAEYDDVLTDSYLGTSLSVSTTQVQAKVGASNLAGREMLYIENKGPKTVYYGPTGVTSSTGARLYNGQFAFLPLGQNVNLFLITASGTSSVVVQEIA